MEKNNSLIDELHNTFSLVEEEELESLLSSRWGEEKFKGLGFSAISQLYLPFVKEIQSREIKVITVGGTNGKGETCYTLSELLWGKGQKSVATWLSPHVLSLRERFLLNQSYIQYSKLRSIIASSFEELEGKHVSYYEFLLYAFFKFALEKSDLDFIVLEVGLGGRLDAVNLVDPDLTAISSIGRDHQEFLGNSLRSILGEKLGITRRGSPLIISLEQKFLQREVAQFCEREGVPLQDLFLLGKLDDSADYRTRNRVLAVTLYNSIMGQREGSAHSCSLLDVATKEYKGRWEEMTMGGGRFIFIGAHNLDGMRKMLVKCCDALKAEKVTGLFSFSSRDKKDISTMLRLIAQGGVFQETVLTEFDHMRGMVGLEELIEDNDKDAIGFERDWKSYIHKKINKQETVLVSGSYYFIGVVQRWLLCQFNYPH